VWPMRSVESDALVRENKSLVTSGEQQRNNLKRSDIVAGMHRALKVKSWL